MRTIEREVVAAHIYSSDNKLLMARNTNPDNGVVYGDCWKIPGGGVESGETKTDALVREVREEVGIDISAFSHELVDDSMTGEAEKVDRATGEKILAKMQFFTYKTVLHKPASRVHVKLDLHEFTEYKWFDVSEIRSAKMSPPSIELFTKLGLL